MATCKDCIHYDVCYFYDGVMDLQNGDRCSEYKDKSRFIELPCRVGDTVYVFGTFHDGIEEEIVKEFCVCEDCILVKSDVWDGVICEAHQIGKVVKEDYETNGYFLTREEAEKALAERNKINACQNDT